MLVIISCISTCAHSFGEWYAEMSANYSLKLAIKNGLFIVHYRDFIWLRIQIYYIWGGEINCFLSN